MTPQNERRAGGPGRVLDPGSPARLRRLHYAEGSHPPAPGPRALPEYNPRIDEAGRADAQVSLFKALRGGWEGAPDVDAGAAAK